MRLRQPPNLLNPAQMGNVISLTPGFSPVTTGNGNANRFNGFSRADKPLKRLERPMADFTRLKPGASEHCSVFGFLWKHNK